MSRRKVLTAGAAVVLALGVGAGIAGARSDSPPTTETTNPTTCAMHGVDMDAMHAEMCSQMEAGMHAEDDFMHGQMAHASQNHHDMHDQIRDATADTDESHMGDAMHDGTMHDEPATCR